LALSVPDKGYPRNVPDKGYPRNGLCALNLLLLLLLVEELSINSI